MRKFVIVATAAFLGAVFLGVIPVKVNLGKPAGPPNVQPSPCPGPGPCPVPAPPPPPPPPIKPKPWGLKISVPVGTPRAFVQSWDEAKVGGSIAPDGKTEIAVDLPGKFHIKNTGGSDGAGLCVFASLTHSSIWQHVRQTEALFTWMRRYPGGGYPQKVDAKIEQISKEQGVESPLYIQVESKDLEILKLACRTRRMPGVTYGFSPTGRYGGGRIAHMVSLAHADDNWFGILDNNYPGSIEWMDPQTFLRVYSSGSSNGWAVIFLNAPPPKAPRNKKG